MGDVRTVTPRELNQITNVICDKPKTILWHGKRISVNPLLSFKDLFEIVMAVVDACVDRDKNVMVVESVDFIFKKVTLEQYGNITFPKGVEEQYKIIYGSDLVKHVWNEVNQVQLSSLKEIIRVYTGIEIV